MILCEYGCGQEATHQFKNGKWCCSKTTNQCIFIKNKNSISSTGKKHNIDSLKKMHFSQIGKTHSEETKKKIRLANLGRIHSEETKLKIGKKSKKRYFSEEARKKMSKSQQGRKHTKETKIKLALGRKGKFHSLESRKKMSESTKNRIISKDELIKRKPTINKYKTKYPIFSKIEKMRYNPDKPDEKEIQVHCKNHNCKNSKEQGGWFTPTYSQLHERIRQIEDLNGTGGSYLYCCNECKEECPLYGKRVSQLIKEDQIRVGLIEDPWYSSQEYQTWRSKVFELDNNKCVYCEQLANIAHHILPQKTHPELSLDPENGISCCDKCHFKYGHQGECSTGNLSKLICERIIRIKEKK